MSDVRRLVVQLAVAKAVADQAKAVMDAVKAELEEAMDPGDRKTAAIDGQDVGTVSYAKTTPEARVTDEAAFIEWVRGVASHRLRWPVTLDANDVVAAWAGEPQASGRVWEAIHARRGQPPTVDPYWQSDLLRQCVKAGAAVHMDTGEEIPGVTYYPGGEGKYVSARISETQLDRLQTLYQTGQVDLLLLATVPPQIEEGPR